MGTELCDQEISNVPDMGIILSEHDRWIDSDLSDEYFEQLLKDRQETCAF